MVSTDNLNIVNLKNSIVSKINTLIGNHNNNSSSHSDIRNNIINYGEVDSTSTSTNFTAMVPNLNSLTDGATVMLRNGVVTSESGFTLNVNGLGAKPVYTNLASATRDTTIFNINYTMLFVFDSDRISGGCWICYRGYDANTNTIGYQVRTNSTKYIATDKGYRYRLWLQTSEDGKFMPVNLSTSTDATANRSSNMNTREFIIGGDIRYNATNGTVNKNAEMSATTLWQQYTLSLGYSFNNTGSALSLTASKPVYMVATPTSNGKARLTSPYYTQILPNSDDGKLYILLGYMYSATSMELTLDHPVFEYRNNSVGLYNPSYSIDEMDNLLDEKADTEHTHTKSEITDFPNIPSKTSDLTNDSGFLTEHNPIDASLSSTSTNAVQNKAVYSVKSQLDGLGDAFSSNMNTIYGTLYNKIDTAGTGLTKEGTTLRHTNSVTAQTSTVFKKISYDGQGHITGTANVTASDIPTLTKSKISDFNHTHNKSEITGLTIPTKTSDLTNDSGFLTEHQSLANYLQKSNTNGLVKNDGTIDTNTYLTEHQSLSDYMTSTQINTLLASKADASDIPTKTSDLTNDGNGTKPFLTTHQSLTDYMTSTQINTLLTGKADSVHNHKWTDINDWIVEQEIKLLETFDNNGVIEFIEFANGILSYDINNDIVIFDRSRFASMFNGLVVDSNDIVNNLTTTSSGGVLDARQGKILNDKFNNYLTTASASSTYVAKDGSKVLSTNDFTDNYKGQLDNLSSTIANAVGNLELFEIAQALPTTNIKNNKLYLVPNSVDGTTNQYDIYIRVNNAWEKIDSLDFDINDYIKKTDSTNLLLANGNNIQQSTFAISNHNHNDVYYTETEIDNLLTGKADSNHTHGNISNEGKLSTTGTVDISRGDLLLFADATIGTDQYKIKGSSFIDALNDLVLDLINEGES